MNSIHHFRVTADRIANCIPVVSLISNLLVLFQRHVFIPRMTRAEIKSNPYYRYINKKTDENCRQFLVPFYGNYLGIRRYFRSASDREKWIPFAREASAENFRQVPKELRKDPTFMLDVITSSNFNSSKIKRSLLKDSSFQTKLFQKVTTDADGRPYGDTKNLAAFWQMLIPFARAASVEDFRKVPDPFRKDFAFMLEAITSSNFDSSKIDPSLLSDTTFLSQLFKKVTADANGHPYRDTSVLRAFWQMAPQLFMDKAFIHSMFEEEPVAANRLFCKKVMELIPPEVSKVFRYKWISFAQEASADDFRQVPDPFRKDSAFMRMVIAPNTFHSSKIDLSLLDDSTFLTQLFLIVTADKEGRPYRDKQALQAFWDMVPKLFENKSLLISLIEEEPSTANREFCREVMKLISIEVPFYDEVALEFIKKDLECFDHIYANHKYKHEFLVKAVQLNKDLYPKRIQNEEGRYPRFDHREATQKSGQELYAKLTTAYKAAWIHEISGNKS